MEEICQRCGEKDSDRRTLWMACFYEMSELDIPFVEITTEDKRKFYTLRVCKECRADWMRAIKEWFNNPPSKESCGSGIFIRENGGIKEITEEEWKENNPDRKPVRIKEQPMPCTIAELLKKLRSAFPETYVSITVSYDLFAHKKCIDIEYNLYFANNIENCRTFTNLKALKSYVEYICTPLTVNDVLNCGGHDLEVK